MKYEVMYELKIVNISVSKIHFLGNQFQIFLQIFHIPPQAILSIHLSF